MIVDMLKAGRQIELDVDTLIPKNEKGIQKFIETSSKLEHLRLYSSLTKLPRKLFLLLTVNSVETLFIDMHEMLALESEEMDKRLKLASERMSEKMDYIRENEVVDVRKSLMRRIGRDKDYFYSFDLGENPKLL